MSNAKLIAELEDEAHLHGGSMRKYCSNDERLMSEIAQKNGWTEGYRNSQNHLTMIHPSGLKYPLPRTAKNKHVLKRVERQMRQMVENHEVV